MTEKDQNRQLELQQMAIDAKVKHEMRLHELQETYTEGVAVLAKKYRASKLVENHRYALEVAEISKEQQEIRFRRERDQETH